MRRWGRHGEIPWVFETLISLVLIALCAYAMFTYIDTNASGERYFSRYHAADLSSIAEIAAAPDADITLRYDNLRDDLDLGFWFTNGEVAVGVPSRVGAALNVESPLTGAFSEPVGAAKGVYAPVKEYRTSAFDHTQSLIVTRRDDTLSISDTPRPKEDCPAGTSKIPIEQTRAWLAIDGAVTPTDIDEARTAFRDVLTTASIPLARDEADATVLVRITRAIGTTTELTTTPSDEVTVALACDLAQQLRIITLEQVAFTLPTIAGQPATDRLTTIVTLTTDNDDRISPTQIGKAAAYATLRRYRS